MYSLIVALLQGIMTGIVQPLTNVFIKRSDVNMQEYLAGAHVDGAEAEAWLQAQVQMAQIRAQSQWWGARAISFGIGAVALTYYAAIMADSVLHFSGHIGMPDKWDGYTWIMLQSFLVTTPLLGPLNGLTSVLRGHAASTQARAAVLHARGVRSLRTPVSSEESS